MLAWFFAVLVGTIRTVSTNNIVQSTGRANRFDTKDDSFSFARQYNRPREVEDWEGALRAEQTLPLAVAGEERSRAVRSKAGPPCGYPASTVPSSPTTVYSGWCLCPFGSFVSSTGPYTGQSDAPRDMWDPATVRVCPIEPDVCEHPFLFFSLSL